MGIIMLLTELSLLMHSDQNVCITLPDQSNRAKTVKIRNSMELFNYQFTFIEKFGIASVEVNNGNVKIINDKFEKR